MSVQNKQTFDKQGNGLGIISRLFWMFLGNVILFISALIILKNKTGTFHAADIVFFITVAAMIIVRYLDIKFFGGYTVTDKPATMSHWKKYLVLLLISSGVVWILAHLINF
jgi:hypothetical protein